MQSSRLTTIFALAALATTALPAQVFRLHGDIEATSTGFRLACSHDIELVSRSFSLRQLQRQSASLGHEYEMKVVDRRIPGRTVLEVLQVQPAGDLIEISQMTVGKTYNVKIAPAQATKFAVFGGLRKKTSVALAPSIDGWILGRDATLLYAGPVVSGAATFQSQLPNDPTMVGVEVTMQAVLSNPWSGTTVTNPDCALIGR